jgi:hypothetical protein
MILWIFVLTSIISCSDKETNKALSVSNMPSEHILYEIPFTIAGEQIIIRLGINEKDTCNFIFDTGTEYAIIDSGLYIDLKLLIKSNISINCPGGNKTFDLVECDYHIGDSLYKNVSTIVASMKKDSKKCKQRIDGIIGNTIFCNNITKINFKEKKITVYKYYTKTFGEIVFPISYRGPSIIAEVELQNGSKIDGNFLIDTGSDFNLTIYNTCSDSIELAKLIGCFKNRKSSDVCGSKMIYYKGESNKLEFGKFIIDKPTTVISNYNTGLFADTLYTGIIGFPILKNYNFCIDLKSEKLYIEQIQF